MNILDANRLSYIEYIRWKGCLTVKEKGVQGITSVIFQQQNVCVSVRRFEQCLAVRLEHKKVDL